MEIPRTDNIILVGFSGTGKSLVGRELARILGRGFVDTDARVETMASKPIAQIFEDDGEAAFRILEREAIKVACARGGNVISVGGGAMVNSENRELMLRSAYVVCLDATPETIHSRLTADGGDQVASRPMLSGSDPLGRIRSLKESRDASYSQAHLTVQTDGLTVEETAGKVANSGVLPQRYGDG